MENLPKILFVFRHSNKEQQLQLSAEKKIPTSAFRGMDYLMGTGKQCGFMETGNSDILRIFNACRTNDTILLSDALMSFALINIFLRKKVYYLNLSGSTLLRYKKGIKRLIFILFLRLVSGVICISRAQIQDMEKVGVPQNKIKYIKFGVDTDFFDEGIHFLKNFNEGYIVSLGRDKGRDFESLFLLAANFPEETFIVATNKSRIPECTVTPKNVVVQYDLTPLQIRELYRGAKCCIVTLKDDTSAEGSDCSGQTVVQETLSTGMPVFCTHREWLDDYYEPFVHYVPLAHGDMQSMTETVTKFLHTPEELCAMGRRGQEETKQRLNTKKFAEDLYKIFQETYA